MNEPAKDVIERNKRLTDWVKKFEELVGKDARPLLEKHAIDDADKLGAALEQVKSEENRLLQIGVVGRVKAGKSSLLNALIFDGRSILPKAATPMTAALTTLAYGEEFHAEVHFYEPEDIDRMRKDSNRYIERLEKEKENAKKTCSNGSSPAHGSTRMKPSSAGWKKKR